VPNRDKELRMKLSKEIKKGRKILRGTIKELGAHLVAAQLYPLGFFEVGEVPAPHKETARNPRPVLLVHGIIHNRSAFVRLKRRMEKLGWVNIFTLNYSTFHGNVLQMVEELGRKVDMVMRKTDAQQIDIVAHSLGGIVSRTYLTLGEGRGKVRRLVTLGTPHQGTHMSFMAKGLSRGALDADLRVNSYLLRLLNNTELPKTSEIVSIHSPFDWTVLPADNAHCTGSPCAQIKNIQLEYIGHMGLLYSSEAFDAIVRSILLAENFEESAAANTVAK
jgi:triacylglycerol lipase